MALAEDPIPDDARVMRRALLALGLALIVHGCAPTLRHETLPRASSAVADADTTWLGRLFVPLAGRHPGESGLHLLDEGREAFALRTALADVAERSIDAQYFIWSGDAVGTVLMERLVRAANRGVRVRLLVDDIYLTGPGTTIAALDAHPNVEIRIYNPVGGRNVLRLGRRLDFLLEFSRLNHRMHNKLFVADNQVAIAGGRNIADAYFGVDPTFNVRDMDVFVAGPVVHRLSTGFDAYWNSGWAVPMSRLRSTPSARQVNRAHELLQRETTRHLEGLPIAVDVPDVSLRDRLTTLGERLTWARAEAVWADPAAGPAGARPGAPSEVGRALEAVIQKTQTELVTVSPYLVPNPDLSLVRAVRARDVQIRILTNSLASTDEPPAYAVYAKDHRRMLGEGVEMYEVRPGAESRHVYTSVTPPGSARLGLHAKLAVFDRTAVYIGSFNLDPRSLYLNTEVALLVHSPVLARAMLDLLERDFRPENAWRLVLERHGDGSKSRVVWIARESDRDVRSSRAPEAGFWRRLGARVYGLLPIRGQL
jgi:putative cardiolipin synthase